jgi:predicted transcriptional regulator
MPAETVRISPGTHTKLKELSELTGEPMTVVLERAIEVYRRERFLDACDQAYARLRADPKAWAEELAERKAWDAALVDGLEDA